MATHQEMIDMIRGFALEVDQAKREGLERHNAIAERLNEIIDNETPENQAQNEAAKIGILAELVESVETFNEKINVLAEKADVAIQCLKTVATDDDIEALKAMSQELNEISELEFAFDMSPDSEEIDHEEISDVKIDGSEFSGDKISGDKISDDEFERGIRFVVEDPSDEDN